MARAMQASRQRFGRISGRKGARISAHSLQSGSCSENYAIPHDLSGQTLKPRDIFKQRASHAFGPGNFTNGCCNRFCLDCFLERMRGGRRRLVGQQVLRRGVDRDRRGAQPASLKQEEGLKPGDTIRTGRNGRVLLVRGEETILIAPNSVIGVPPRRRTGCRPPSCSRPARSCSRSKSATSSISRSRRRTWPPSSRARSSASP